MFQHNHAEDNTMDTSENIEEHSYAWITDLQQLFL